jgi:uncharacterized protein YcfJ
MKLTKFAACAVSAAVLVMPLSVLAQESHEDAKAQVERHDAHHHTKAKIVGGSAVGGAIVGAKVGGPGGALVGAGVGAGGGLVANHIRKHHAVKEHEKYDTPESPR